MAKVRGKVFELGNTQGRGRPPGSLNKTNALWQEMLDKYAEPIMKKCVAMALQGDRPAIRLCMERMVAPVRDTPVNLVLPSSATQEGIAKAFDAVMEAVAQGRITPEQGETLANILELRRRALESGEMQARLKKLEDLTA